jgi:hypothetical protein
LSPFWFFAAGFVSGLLANNSAPANPFSVVEP